MCVVARKKNQGCYIWFLPLNMNSARISLQVAQQSLIVIQSVFIHIKINLINVFLCHKVKRTKKNFWLTLFTKKHQLKIYNIFTLFIAYQQALHQFIQLKKFLFLSQFLKKFYCTIPLRFCDHLQI